MKISFPYMGCVTAYKKLLELLGHEVIMPQKPGQRTFELGVLYSPEFICYPSKVMAGTYIEACEKGAEIIVTSGGKGPCRAGMYGEIHKRILKKLGYNVQIIVFDSPFAHPKKFFDQIMLIKNKTPMYKLIKYVRFTFEMIKQMDEIEKEIKLKRPYEVHKDDFNKCYNKIVKMYECCNTKKDLDRTYKKAWEMLLGVPVNEISENKKLRIGIVGEIFVVMESSTNMNIEKRLNSLGAEVENIQSISKWIGHYLPPAPFNKSKSRQICKKGKRYLACNSGGHNLENTGAIMDFAERGFDGVVHIQPFGCLPELVTRSMIPKITNDFGIPVLSVSIDEQTGEANTQTRLEAFIDLCKKSSSMPKQSSADKVEEAKSAV